MDISEELLDYIEKIKVKINDKEYMDILNLIVKKRENEVNFYKVTYIYVENVKNIEEEDMSTVNYVTNIYKKEFYYPFTKKDIDDITIDNNKIYDITRNNDFDTSQFYSSQLEVKIDIQIKNFYILDIRKVN